MIAEMKDTLVLDDDNEYVVVSKINYKEKFYYYLVDIKNNGNLKFCYEDGEELVELSDKVLTTELLPLFLEASKDVLDINLENMES